MTAPATFSKADLARAVSGCLKAGMEVGAVVIRPNGEIVICRAGADSPAAEPANPLDRLLDR